MVIGLTMWLTVVSVQNSLPNTTDTGSRKKSYSILLCGYLEMAQFSKFHTQNHFFFYNFRKYNKY